MNSTVTSGTPRTNSMKMTDSSPNRRHVRPPSERQQDSERQRENDADRGNHDGHQHAAPQTVSTGCRPIAAQPVSRMNDETGKITKK